MLSSMFEFHIERSYVIKLTIVFEFNTIIQQLLFMFIYQCWYFNGDLIKFEIFVP